MVNYIYLEILVLFVLLVILKLFDCLLNILLFSLFVFPVYQVLDKVAPVFGEQLLAAVFRC